MRTILACCIMFMVGCSGAEFSADPQPPPAGGEPDAATTTTLPLATGGANSATGGGSVLSPTGGAAQTTGGGSAVCELVTSPNCESPDIQPGAGWQCVVNLSACPAAGFPLQCSHCK